MGIKIFLPSALALVVVASCAAWAQPPSSASPSRGVELPPPTPVMERAPSPDMGDAEAPPMIATAPAHLDDWITYQGPGSCHCPVGSDGPIRIELYVRAGPEFPIGGGVYTHTLTPGWEIQGGARTLFFEPDMASAWVVDLGVVNIWNQGTNAGFPFPLTVDQLNPLTGTSIPVTFGNNGVPPLTVQDLNRTYASVGAGKEWWVHTPADGADWRCRLGLDAGPRLGTGSARFHEIRHLTGTMEAIYAAFHLDVEVPCGACCSFYTGLRAEYSYTYSNILQHDANANLQDMSLLLNFGIRF